MASGILVSFAGYPYALSSLFPDNGLASLAAVSRREGHECSVLDYNTPETIARLVDDDDKERLETLLARLSRADSGSAVEPLQAVESRMAARGRALADDIGAAIAKRCKAEGIDYIGFKLWSGDGFGLTVRIAQRIRAECPGVKLFAGGPAVHYSGHVVPTEATVFDAVVDGDGEEALVELIAFVEGRQGLEKVPNLVGPRAPNSSTATLSDLSSLPDLCYAEDAYPAVGNGEKIKLLTLDESRGCPMGCAFCINCRIEGHRWRTRPAEQVVAQMQRLREQIGTRFFRLAGTYSPPALLRQICDEIVRREVDVRFCLFVHANGADKPLIDSLVRAGCFGMFVGVESGSDQILKQVMNKSTTAKRLKAALTTALDAGLFTVGSLIFPAPFETPETEAATKRFIEEVFAGRPNCAVNPGFPGLLPNTLWWNERSRFGFDLSVNEDDYRRLLLNYKIRHIIPPHLWEELPYSVQGQPQRVLARRNAEFQRWLCGLGLGINLGDHDAMIGQALGYTPADFAQELRRVFFTGDANAAYALVASSNEILTA